jgi:hypothetical protein
MNLFKWRQAMLPLALVAFFSVSGPALAVTNAGGVPTATPYVAAFTPTFGIQGVPYAGTMQLVVQNGIVSGTYTGISVRPDRLNDRIVPIVGTVSDSNGQMQFHVGGALWFNGTMYADGTISGTATYYGRFYDFLAKPGVPGGRR